jgi:hypothetical protein
MPKVVRELHFFMVDTGNYFTSTWEKVSPLWVAFVSVVNYVLFPDKAYIPAATALVLAMFLDIITKYYAISSKNGGLFKSIRDRKITSNQFWTGTQKKIISYLVVMILCGLSVRVTMLTSVAVFLSTVAYSIMFLREAHSCVENLIDAGHSDLEWLLFWLKRKQSKVLEEDPDTTTATKSSTTSSTAISKSSSDSKGGTEDVQDTNISK